MIKQKTNRKLLDFQLGRKRVLWIADNNKYIVAEPLAASVILDISIGLDDKNVVDRLQKKNKLSLDEATYLVDAISKQWSESTEFSVKNKTIETKQDLSEQKSYSTKRYQINDFIFQVDYESSEAEWYNHPKFAHLEVSGIKQAHHYFKVNDQNGRLSLWVDGIKEGTWSREENHFLSGRFSMKIIEKIYQKEELEWMGIFHAAGISNDKQSLLFFGESGSGKSTLSALAMAAGLDVLSDDFLPVDSNSGLVHRFPAALSIKKNAYDLLNGHYPELQDAFEYENPAFGKIYRYLALKNQDLKAVPCKAIIDIKYDPRVPFSLEKIPAEDAFAKIVPDSWINPSPENAKRFVEWFVQMQHYSLRYSDNAQMLKCVKKLLDETS